MEELDRLSIEVPVIRTDRLRLRCHRMEDLAACKSMWSDPDVTRYLGRGPLSAEEVWGRLLRYLGHWAFLKFGFWALEEKATGSFLGELGFMDFHRGIEAIEGVPEIGWILASRAHGKGYATEAVRAAVAWSDSRFSQGKTACIISPENQLSIRVATKCGYVQTAQTTYQGRPVILFQRQAFKSAP